MQKRVIQVEVQPLKVKLKSAVRHAAANRNSGDSLWVRARRGSLTGYGEGCPRSYSAGDDVESSIAWIQEHFSAGAVSFHTVEDMMEWLDNNAGRIDRYPSAWCAIEMAMLDLFSQERRCSVENLLGMNPCKRYGRYTAVLGDEKSWQYGNTVDQYLVRGFKDFKIKVNGNIDRDKEKIALLLELCEQHGVSNPRIRLDANNLWRGRTEEAIVHLGALEEKIFAVEEPVGSGDPAGISRVSVATGLPVILDESLCTHDDLLPFKNLPGKFIANIKVSRVGGIIRALRLIDAVKKMGWSVIIGCHVGETSLLTRAALIPANAAREDLIAQEGAYGDYLVEREPVEPILKFGRHGRMDLDAPYFYKTVHGLQAVPVENWERGFGMKCRWPAIPDDGNPELLTLEMSDQYKIHYRLWGPTNGGDVLLVLHGGMSHSAWQAPLANALRAGGNSISIVAPDRRGCGLNEGSGDLGSVESVIGDLVKQIEQLKGSYERVHLAGWCQGCQYAAVAANRTENLLSSLILLTPGFFWNERFRSVIRIAGDNLFALIKELKLKPARTHAYIPIPMEDTDFTLKEEWLDFIENDKLKTSMITMRTAFIMDEIQELSWTAMLQNRLPVLTVLAENDRIVDNRKVQQFMGHMFSPESRNRLVTFDSGHAIHFERPHKAADEILSFIESV